MKNENEELEFNQQNREEYENLMKEASPKVDQYWDSNNVFVRVFFYLLGVGIIAGVIYYLLIYIEGR